MGGLSMKKHDKWMLPRSLWSEDMKRERPIKENIEDDQQES